MTNSEHRDQLWNALSALEDVSFQGGKDYAEIECTSQENMRICRAKRVDAMNSAGEWVDWAVKEERERHEA